MRNCSAICAEMVEGMVGVEEVPGDMVTATTSAIIFALVKWLDQKLLNQIPSS